MTSDELMKAAERLRVNAYEDSHDTADGYVSQDREADLWTVANHYLATHAEGERVITEATDGILGVMKMLKPMRFKRSDAHWSDGFRQHGIFEVISKRRGEDGQWRNTIRRIATFRNDCELSEEYEMPEAYLNQAMVPTDLASFGGVAMAEKLSVNRLLQLACIYAERDQEAFIEAVANCTHPSDVNAREDAEQFVKQVRAYRRRRWGKSASDIFNENATTVTVQEVIQRSIKKGK